MSGGAASAGTPGSSREHPLPRPAARVLLIDGEDRLLLFRAVLPHRPGQRLWITPGGGCHPGETYEAAAQRELWEETGIRAAPGPCVWTRRHVFDFNGLWLDESERFFVLRLPAPPELSRANFEAHEHAFMPEHRWWRPEEIAFSSDWFAPRALARLLPPILSGPWPDEPFDCGV